MIFPLFHRPYVSLRIRINKVAATSFTCWTIIIISNKITLLEIYKKKEFPNELY